MILRRFDSSEVLGVVVHANMEINTIIRKLEEGLEGNPEYTGSFYAAQQMLNVAKVLDDEASVLLDSLNDMMSLVAELKRLLETAQKVLNNVIKLEMGKMDLKPAANGMPLAIGVTATISPLQVAVETALTNLNDAEDLLKEKASDLMLMTDAAKEAADEAKAEVINQIMEISNSNIAI